VKLPGTLATVLKITPEGRGLSPITGRRSGDQTRLGAPRKDADLDEAVNPYSIRHTVVRWTRQLGRSG
jgi:hypothetical protein